MGMRQLRQNLPFLCEASQHRFGVHATLDDFERDFAVEAAVGAPGAVHGAHATGPDDFGNLVTADPGANERRIERFQEVGRRGGNELFQILLRRIPLRLHDTS